jgi:YaiO family outer membrane protein
MKTKYYFLPLLFLCWLPMMLSAQQHYPQRSITANIIYDYLTPDSLNHDWKSLEVSYSHRFDTKHEAVISSGGSIRKDKLCWLQGAVYLDWLPKMYTYSSVGFASKTDQMGRLRLDNDIKYKLGNKLQYIVGTGQTVILNNNDTAEYLLSLGGVYYQPHWVGEARYFFSKPDPGQKWSNSLRMSLGFGTQGRQWSTVTAGTGIQTNFGIGSPPALIRNATSLDLNQQIWLSPGKGIKVGLGYLRVTDGFDKYNFSLGCFYRLP